MIFKRIYKTGLCPNDLNKQVKILERKTLPLSPGETSPTISFPELGSFMAGIETRKGVERALDININSDSTHFFYFMYSSRLDKREPKNTFILFRNEHYKVLDVENVNEENRYLIYYTSLRGKSTQEESKA